MPAFLRGFVTCDTCSKTATVIARVSERQQFELWWELPEGWLLYTHGRSAITAFCSNKCNTHSASMGSPDQRGRRSNEPATYDARTIDKLFELMENAPRGTSADNVLAAIEMVLTAWRQGAPFT